jgi:hypothetical protein
VAGVRGFTPTLRHEGQWKLLVLDFQPPVTHESRGLLALPIVQAFVRRSRLG